MEYKKVEQKINNIVNDNVKMLAQLFPSAVKDGEVDFEALKEELGEFQEVGSEKYELTWAGKQNAKKVAQEDVYGKTLKFIHEDSKDAEATENLYIEGDNLEVLKLLRQNYYGAIKMIYIDPPYNTGNDFVYNDKFTLNSNDSEKAEGNIDINGERYTVNSKSQNRFHANWLNMMYPRLRLAKDLLSDDGVIFISIDDNEVDNLRKICDEIFSRDCFVCSAIWKSSDNSNNDAKQFSNDHNETLIYSKQAGWQPNKISDDNKRTHFKNPDNDPRGAWFDGNPLNSPNYRENLIYDIISPKGNIIKAPKNGWRWSKSTLEEKMKSGEIRFNEDETGIKRRTYLCDMEGLPPSSLWVDLEQTGHNRQAKYELLKLLPEDVFDTPKPVKLIKYIIGLLPQNEDSIIMDFFSGSGTTADAVMQLNAEDGGKRKFVMIQLPENLDEGILNASNDKRKVFDNAIKLCDKMNAKHQLSEIAKERIRRAGDKILSEHPSLKGKLDVGFKVFQCGHTNIKWNSQEEISEQITTDTAMYTPDLMDFFLGAKDTDIVYELMLRQKDVKLSSQLEQLNDIGERTYLYASSYLVCLETQITKELIDKLSELNPLPIKFIFRDSAFEDNIALKDETFRRLKALIEKNAGSNKITYTVEFI